MVDIIAVTYGQNEILKCFINSIKSQTSSNWRLVIIHDGPNLELEKQLINENYLIKDKIEFYQYPNRTENYGHKLRKWGLENLVKNEYVLLTNGDNYYVPIMIEEVIKYDSDIIYFDMVHSHKTKNNNNEDSYGFIDSKLKRGFVDMGNVIIKSNLAKKVGFNSIGYAADWEYFDSVLKLSQNIIKINKILFVHN